MVNIELSSKAWTRCSGRHVSTFQKTHKLGEKTQRNAPRMIKEFKEINYGKRRQAVEPTAPGEGRPRVKCGKLPLISTLGQDDVNQSPEVKRIYSPRW